MTDVRVIIAIKSQDDSNLIKGMLIRGGYNVVALAHDGVTALKLIRNYEPDLVLLDADLPGMNGVEVAKILEEEKLVPVILISTYYRQDLITKGKDAMVMACLIKPITQAELAGTVEVALANYDKIRSLQQEIVKLKGFLEDRKAVEKAKGLLMSKLDIPENEAFKKIQKLSMEKRKPMKDIAESIIIAYEM